MPPKVLKIHISGNVHGVGFRINACKKAQKLNLTGYVQNQPDGSVELIALGSQLNLEKLTAWCKHGPPRAVVTNLTIQELPLEKFQSSFDNFSIKPTE